MRNETIRSEEEKCVYCGEKENLNHVREIPLCQECIKEIKEL